MAAYQEPGYDQRRAAAAAAREKALEKLKARPTIDPVVLAERIAAAEARDNAKAEKREALKARKAQEQLEKAQIAESLAPSPGPTEAERKAARDAKYAARKARKK